MHAHSVLMLAAVGIVAAFVPVVLVVRWLETHRHIRAEDGPMPFRAYGAILAGGFSAGSAAVHIAAIGDHAIRSASTTGDPALFLCSVGAVTTHVTTFDPSIAGLVPMGAATLVIAPVQAAWAVPRLWRQIRIASVGVIVAAASLLLGAGRILLGRWIGRPLGDPVADITSTVLVVEGLLAIGLALMVAGRPRRLVERLDARPGDAWVATGLGLAAAAILSATAIWADHIAH